MSVFVVIRRGQGIHPGDNITDSLITTLPVALERGRNEMDDHAHGLQPVTISIPFRTGIRLGQVVEVKESLFGQTWYGKIVSITHQFQLASLTTNLQIKRPTAFVT